MSEMPRTKTSIYIDEDLWKEWQIYVIRNYGGRKISTALEDAIRAFMKSNKKI